MTLNERPANPAEDAVVHVMLRQDARGAGDARAAARRVLGGWRVSTKMMEDVVLAVSELVTNALRYGRAPVELTLSRKVQEVRVDVHDDGIARIDVGPRRTVAAEAVSGRGFAIVTALADKVGCDTPKGRRGKTVYATFLLPAVVVTAGLLNLS